MFLRLNKFSALDFGWQQDCMLGETNCVCYSPAPLCCIVSHSGGDLAPSLGGGKKFRGPRFLNDVSSGKISIFTDRISDDLFLVINQVFQIFPFPRFSISLLC